MSGFTCCGKEVKDRHGNRFCDATTPVNALLITAAMNFPGHRAATDGERVYCSRCQEALPERGLEPCQPKPKPCPETLDLFDAGHTITPFKIEIGA